MQSLTPCKPSHMLHHAEYMQIAITTMVQPLQAHTCRFLWLAALCMHSTS